MDNTSTNSNSDSQQLNALIKKTWDKLTDEEIGFHANALDKFFAALQTKYSINKDEVEKTMKKLDAECAADSGRTDGKDAETGSAPLPKAANAETGSAASLPKAANA